MFLSVPPSYQYLHSPFINHISPIHSFTFHHSPFAHPPTFLLVFFGKAPFYPKSTRRIIEQHPKESGNKVDKSGQRWSELVKRGQTWTNMDKRGQRWSELVKHGQTWTKVVKRGKVWTKVVKHGQTWTSLDKGSQIWSNMVKRGQTWSNLVRIGQITQGKCLVFSCVISLGNHSKKI